jgi:ribosomal protein S14
MGGQAMELRTHPHKTGYQRLSNTCAQCGDAIFMPEWSEYLSEYRVRHLWQCEACGYKFETLVKFSES